VTRAATVAALQPALTATGDRMRSLSTFVSLLVTSTLALAQGMPAGVPVKGTPVEVQGQPMQGG